MPTPVVITRRLWAIYGNQVKDLPDRQALLDELLPQIAGRNGIADSYSVQEGENPYANKRNTLTPTQMRKRKRLMKHIKKNK